MDMENGLKIMVSFMKVILSMEKKKGMESISLVHKKNMKVNLKMEYLLGRV
jgi:hypothetical protein